MSYTLAADVYIGDVSSQIYEFIYTSKPCLFINSHEVAWRGDSNYLHWNLGLVLPNIQELEKYLKNIEVEHEPFKKIQKEYFNYTFSLSTNESSSFKAAKEIVTFIKE
jgi:CDP-glycerol glycerophosphotransferase (TagB/SpsB family)